MHLGVKRLSEDGMVADLGHVRMFGGKFCNMVRHERLFIIFSVLPHLLYLSIVAISERPMFCRNVDSFPFRQISGAPYVHFLAKVMPKFSVNFGMTSARN